MFGQIQGDQVKVVRACLQKMLMLALAAEVAVNKAIIVTSFHVLVVLAWLKNDSLLFNLRLPRRKRHGVAVRSVATRRHASSNSSRPRKTAGGVLDWH